MKPNIDLTENRDFEDKPKEMISSHIFTETYKTKKCNICGKTIISGIICDKCKETDKNMTLSDYVKFMDYQ